MSVDWKRRPRIESVLRASCYAPGWAPLPADGGEFEPAVERPAGPETSEAGGKGAQGAQTSRAGELQRQLDPQVPAPASVPDLDKDGATRQMERGLEELGGGRRRLVDFGESHARPAPRVADQPLADGDVVEGAQTEGRLRPALRGFASVIARHAPHGSHGVRMKR